MILYEAAGLNLAYMLYLYLFRDTQTQISSGPEPDALETTMLAFVKSFSVADAPAVHLKSSQLHGALKDCTSGALAFFGGVRIPSTLVAGSTLATAFLYTRTPEGEGKLGRNARRAQYFFALAAFCLSITSVVTTTTTGTSLLLDNYNPMASDVYHFLKREFEFEFILTR